MGVSEEEDIKKQRDYFKCKSGKFPKSKENNGYTNLCISMDPR